METHVNNTVLGELGFLDLIELGLARGHHHRFNIQNTIRFFGTVVPHKGVVASTLVLEALPPAKALAKTVVLMLFEPVGVLQGGRRALKPQNTKFPKI